MSWRTVVISRRCKLDLSMGYLVVRAEDTTRILIEEISVLLLENPAISLTGCLLAELTRQKVRVLFCDEKRSPYAELQPYNGSFDCSRKIRIQIGWTENQKGTVWTEIVAEKIRNQAKFLQELQHTTEADLLTSYLTELCYADETNREGHAAKVYFNALFGKGFSRGKECPTNAALNYGYGLLLSAFNREVTLNGYLPHLGLFHDNMFNPYNLSCDLMEPFRILVDRMVVQKKITDFGKEEKHAMLSLLHTPLRIDQQEQTVLNAIKIYTHSVFDAVNDMDPSRIRFAEI